MVDGTVEGELDLVAAAPRAVEVVIVIREGVGEHRPTRHAPVVRL